MNTGDTTRAAGSRAARFRSISPRAALFVFLFAAAFFSACSSGPERADEIFSDRNTAVKQLELANFTANRGRYEDALVILEDARRLAVSTDDPPLRIKTSISRGNFLFALGRGDEAFREWESASAEGDSSGETALAALARICGIRARIVLLGNNADGNSTAGEDVSAAANVATANFAEEYKAQLDTEMIAVKSDAFSTAAGNIALGLAEKQLGRPVEAEAAVKNALAFYERNRDLEDAAYAWFIIASIRSTAGNYDAAIEALMSAIAFDRRAENGFGLASSWQAVGEVHRKAGRTEDARSAFRRAAEIYRAIGLNDRAVKAEAAF